MLRVDQLAIHLLVEAPAVFSAANVGNRETSSPLKLTYAFDDVCIKEFGRHHLAEHNIANLNQIMISYWLVSARVAATYYRSQRIP